MEAAQANAEEVEMEQDAVGEARGADAEKQIGYPSEENQKISFQCDSFENHQVNAQFRIAYRICSTRSSTIKMMEKNDQPRNYLS
ncbi:hypothetical protein B9Z55_022882 [Caenorhabditis nigoni]|uniref:Uncharacterized protein n=1 Tax=Caenorhabditis nigoni TaxID=1611254 RepID=A0A2G5SMU9_9PELO|nr:hypothetical protein B9Z55_022882 [Caenorhabditis nigoni]